MDHIAGDLVRTQLTGDLQTLFLREVGDTAHPCAEAPKGQHGRLTRNVSIFVENVLRFSEEDKEVHLLIAHKQTVGTDIRGTKVAGHRSRGVHKHTIATVREEERHRLILTVGLRPLRIGNTEVYLLSYLIQGGERLTATVDALTWC